MRRLVWAWPAGMIGNALLFTVFLGGVFATPQAHDLYGQAGRQVFFLVVSVYGWWRWARSRRPASRRRRRIVPAGPGPGTLALLVALAVVGTAVVYPVLTALGSWGPLPDAWILVGSLLATYGMARGWVEFWLIWIAVDAVGVSRCCSGGFYPSAVHVPGLRRVLRRRLRRLARAPAVRARPRMPAVACASCERQVPGMSAREEYRLDTIEQAIADIAAGRPWSWSTTRTARTRAT